LETTIQFIGSLAAVITTIGWFPQVLKIVRERRADDISLVANAAIAAGVMLWFVYGLMIESWPVIIANGVTFLLIAGGDVPVDRGDRCAEVALYAQDDSRTGSHAFGRVISGGPAALGTDLANESCSRQQRRHVRDHRSHMRLVIERNRDGGELEEVA
jgi:MtN3 and saliva related transmembrane protein